MKRIGILCGFLLYGSWQALAISAEDELLERYRRGALTTASELAAAANILVDRGRDDPQLFHDALRAYDAAIAAAPDKLEVQVALGDLFLSKYNAEQARETYSKVLARDETHAGALLGLAKVQRFDGASDVSELITKVLDSDPEHAGARLLLARQYLDLEDYSASDREADRVLARDPKSAEAHALLAASALLAAQEDRFRELLAKIEEVAPGQPEPFVILAETAARNRLYDRAVELADRAVGIDEKAWRGWAQRGINRLRIGEMEAGRRDLETAFAGDPFDVWTKNTLDLLDRLGKYQSLEHDRFELVLPEGEAQLLPLYLTPLAEESYRSLADLYDIELPTPVRIEIFPRHADFSVRTIGLAGLGALGVSFGPVIALDAPSARPAGELHWGAVLWHELAHSFHLHLSDGRVPRWLTEGLAVFEERRARPGWGDRVTPDFLLAYLDDRLAPVEDLNQGFMRPEYPQQIAYSYLQASLVCDYIVERWSFDAILRMLRAYGGGLSTAAVFRQVLDVGLADFARSYDAYFKERFAQPLSALEASDREPVELAELRRRADSQENDYLAQHGVGHALLEAAPEEALPYLERAKALFPEYAGEDSAYWLLARAHRHAGRLEEASRELEALVKRNQAHYRGLRALAEIRAELEDFSGAARALENAQLVYPYEAEDHLRLAEWLAASGEAEASVRERRAVLALDPFNRPRALYQLAQAQHAAGDPRSARRTVLEALESAPNYEDALELLLELRREREEKR